MKKIEEDLILKVAKRINEINREDAALLISDFKREQPAMLGFLMSVGQEHLNQDEREWLVYLGITIWQSVVESGQKLPVVTSGMFDSAIKKTSDMVAYIKGEPETLLPKTMEQIMATYPQPGLLKYVVSAVAVAQKDKRSVRQENVVMTFFFLKILIDCIDGACAGGK